jgi:hypothetical protein
MSSRKPHQHVLYVDHCSQHTKAIIVDQAQRSGLGEKAMRQTLDVLQKAIDSFDRGYFLGNDTLMCTPHNPLVSQMARDAESHYQLVPPLSTKMLERAYAAHHVKEVTMKNTGPSVLARSLADVTSSKHSVSGSRVHYRSIGVDGVSVLVGPVRTPDYSLTEPDKPGLMWLKTPVFRQVKSKEEAIAAVMQALNFKVEHFRILRLNDHMDFLRMSCGCLSMTVTETDTLCRRFFG